MRYCISARAKPAFYILRCYRSQRLTNRLDQLFFGACFGSAQERFDFAPHFLDGIEVWAGGGQETKLCTRLLNQVPGLLIFVCGKIVQYDGVACA